MNSRNSVKVGDRNSSVGCTQSSFGIWNGADDSASDTPTMACSSCHSASGRSNTWSLSFRSDPSSGSRVHPLHQRRGDQADHEGCGRADRAHDQHRRHRAGDPTPLEIAGGRRQHGADHEGGHNREEERLGDIEDGDDADDQQRDQCEGHQLGAPDHRRQFASALSQWRAGRLLRKRTLVGKDTQLALPAARWRIRLKKSHRGATKRAQTDLTCMGLQRFRRANVSCGSLDITGVLSTGGGTAQLRSR